MSETKGGQGQISITYDSGVRLEGEISLKARDGWKLSASGNGPGSGKRIEVDGNLEFAIGRQNSSFVFEGQSVFMKSVRLTGIFECSGPL